jgi:CubicO group peptidase (beta-lactamase class C family)
MGRYRTGHWHNLGPDKQPRMLMGNLEYGGSSTLVTTTRDLAKWDENFYQPKVGDQAFIDAMRVRGKLTDGKQLEYAGGLWESDTHGLPIEPHDGAFAGYRSWLARYPTKRLTVSVLCNTSQANAVGLGEKVAGLFLPDLSAPEPPPAGVPLEAFGFDLKTIRGRTSNRRSRRCAPSTPPMGASTCSSANSGPPRDLIPVGLEISR